MPRVILSKELVKEITKMPVKEKDKLLMRLIRKDGLLAEQLEFQLIEFGETTEERRNMTVSYTHLTLPTSDLV